MSIPSRFCLIFALFFALSCEEPPPPVEKPSDSTPQQSCVPVPNGEEGQACCGEETCAQGLHCVCNICEVEVSEPELDAGVVIVPPPVDAGMPPSPTIDSGPDPVEEIDSGVIDVVTIDAGMPDAGMPDAGPTCDGMGDVCSIGCIEGQCVGASVITAGRLHSCALHYDGRLFKQAGFDYMV